MNTMSKAGALLLGAALAAGLAGCKNRAEETAAPVTPPATLEPAPVTPAAPPADAPMPPPDTTPPPATGTTPGTPAGTSGDSGTQGGVGSGQPPSSAPDKIDHKDPQRERRPTY